MALSVAETRVFTYQHLWSHNAELLQSDIRSCRGPDGIAGHLIVLKKVREKLAARKDNAIYISRKVIIPASYSLWILKLLFN